jgi:hypothetical protein
MTENVEVLIVHFFPAVYELFSSHIYNQIDSKKRVILIKEISDLCIYQKSSKHYLILLQNMCFDINSLS